MMPTAAAQRGVVLIIALITLLIVTILGVTSATIVRTSLKVASNIEARATMRNAIQVAFSEALAYGQLFNPNLPPFPTQCSSGGIGIRSTCIDVTGDGAANAGDDIVIQLDAPRCVVVSPVMNDELDVFNRPEDRQCYKALDQDSLHGADNQSSNVSYCVDVTIELTFKATDATTGGVMAYKLGAAQRATEEQVASLCAQAS